MDADEIAAGRHRRYLLCVGHVWADGGIEQVHRAARWLGIERPQPAQEGGDANAAGDPELPAGALVVTEPAERPADHRGHAWMYGAGELGGVIAQRLNG